MPKIDPFKAYRFSCNNTQIKKQVCPPYDIIPPTLEKELHHRKVNAVQIELPKGTPKTKYKNAAKIWKSWLKKGTVKEDSLPAFYLYEQTFQAEGKKISRRGFFCALKLEKPGAGSVLRHELTLAKPKEDRMHLLTDLNVNTSPIFGIFKDPQKTARKIFEAALNEAPQVQFKDEENIIHKLWIVSDSPTIEKLKNLIAKEPVLIADGHHRYETAWSYSLEHPEIAGARSALFFLSPVGDKGLVVFPTHRIFRKDEPLDGFLKKVELTNCFQYRKIGNIHSSVRSMSAYNFIVSDGHEHYLIQNNSLSNLKEAIQSKSLHSIQHPLVQIHSLLLPNYLKEDFIYVHEYKEALNIAKENRKLTLIVPPTSIEHMYKIVQSGEVMPQKSTYFYPKIWSGILFRSLL